MTVFRRIVTGRDVERSVREHVRRWSPDYLAEVAEQAGRERGVLAPFRAYLPSLDLSKFAEDQVPALVVVAPGTLTDPVRTRSNGYTAVWQVGLGCIVSGQDRDNTFELTQLYAAAVRTILVQKPSCGVDFVTGVDWIGERYDELDADDQRSIMAGSVQFGVTVEGAVDSRGGPAEPSADPTVAPPDWGTVTGTSAETTEHGS